MRVTAEERARQREKARLWRAKPENAAKNRANARAWRLAHPERDREAKKQYRTTNQAAIAARKKLWAKAHPEKTAKQHSRKRLRRYGLTQAQYEALLIKQKNACAMCSKPFKVTPHIDHCHRTKKVRGLLCARCNVGLGVYERLAELAAAYLKRTGE